MTGVRKTLSTGIHMYVHTQDYCIRLDSVVWCMQVGVNVHNVCGGGGGGGVAG